MTSKQEKLIYPLSVRFVQDHISSNFRDGRAVTATLKSIEAAPGVGPFDVVLHAPFPLISVVRWKPPCQGEAVQDDAKQWFSLNNRRLYCLQQAAAALWPLRVGALVEVLPWEAGILTRVYNSSTQGRSLIVKHENAALTGRWDWRGAITRSGTDTVSEQELTAVWAIHADEDADSAEELVDAHSAARTGRPYYVEGGDTGEATPGLLPNPPGLFPPGHWVAEELGGLDSDIAHEVIQRELQTRLLLSKQEQQATADKCDEQTQIWLQRQQARAAVPGGLAAEVEGAETAEYAEAAAAVYEASSAMKKLNQNQLSFAPHMEMIREMLPWLTDQPTKQTLKQGSTSRMEAAETPTTASSDPESCPGSDEDDTPRRADDTREKWKDKGMEKVAFKMCGSWMGSKGETYTVGTLGSRASEVAWRCVRQDRYSGVKKSFTITLDRDTNTFWWGIRGTYFLDCNELREDSDCARWYPSCDLDKKRRSRTPGFCWQRSAEFRPPSGPGRTTVAFKPAPQEPSVRAVAPWSQASRGSEAASASRWTAKVIEVASSQDAPTTLRRGRWVAKAPGCCE
mmetsp:Transcript_94737/g.203497  ORF Transcript_94737/g.203497 Transcript_94737/m.203497 type:complete len:569 (+) Transcript_94737:123-1829(+)